MFSQIWGCRLENKAEQVQLGMANHIYKFTFHYDEAKHLQAGFQPEKEEPACTWQVDGATEPESLTKKAEL